MDWLKGLILDRALGPVWKFLDGKKTVLGAVAVALSALVQIDPSLHSVDLLLTAVMKQTEARDADTIAALALLLVGVTHKIAKFWHAASKYFDGKPEL